MKHRYLLINFYSFSVQMSRRDHIQPGIAMVFWICANNLFSAMSNPTSFAMSRKLSKPVDCVLLGFPLLPTSRLSLLPSPFPWKYVEISHYENPQLLPTANIMKVNVESLDKERHSYFCRSVLYCCVQSSKSFWFISINSLSAL